MTYLFKDPSTILRTPYRKADVPDDTLRKKVAGYFSSTLSKPRNRFLNLLPQIMPSWGAFWTVILSGVALRLERERVPSGMRRMFG